MDKLEELEKVQEDVVYTTIKDPYGFIYISTNLINGKRYLGQKKFGEGQWVWKDYIGSGLLFKKAVEKYGEENFSRNIVLICNSAEELNKTEYELSVLFNVVESDDWYNLVFGGGTSRGWHPSDETRTKISEKAKDRLSDPAKHPMYGKHNLQGEDNPMYGISPKERMDDDTYQQWYQKHQEYWASGIKKGKKIWTNIPHPNLGKQLPQKTRDKISKSRTGKKDINRCKKVYCIELNEIFYGASEAHDLFGFNLSLICECCKGNKKSAGKHPDTNIPLHWIYVEDAVKLGYITQQQLDNYLNSLKGD